MIKYVIPDIHLDLNYRSIDRTEDIFKALDQIRTEILQLPRGEAVTIIFLGDIFDHPNVSYSLICRFIDYLYSFPNDEYRRFYFRILKGNHDGEPDSRKGSPLQIIEVISEAKVIWEPQIIKDELYIPYCTQDCLDAFYLKNIKDKNLKFEYTFTHIDIPEAIPGFEQQLSRGAPCIMPDWVKQVSNTVMSGHIHKPQHFENVTIVGSLIAVDASEASDNKVYYKLCDNTIEGIPDSLLGQPVIRLAPEAYPIESRLIIQYDFNFALPQNKLIFEQFLTFDFSRTPDSILIINIICPHNIAHEFDQFKIKEVLRKKCKHLLFDFKIVKERSFRMKELNKNLPDRDITANYITAMNLSDKDEIMNTLDKEIFNG